MSITCSSAATISKNGTRTLGYTLQSTVAAAAGEQQYTVVRSEQALQEFHESASRALQKQGKPVPSFPLAHYRTGLELVPGACFLFAWYLTHFHYELDPMRAAGASLAAAAVALLLVLGVGLVAFPARWAAKKRLEPLTRYLMAMTQALDGGMENELLRGLLLPSAERADWPSRFGAIDLDEHDLPHEECSTEWWYFNSHFTAKNEENGETRAFSFFASFFRIVKHVDAATGKKHFGHAVTWALVDPERKEYHFDVVLDQEAPKDLLRAMEGNARVGASDPLLRRALVDVLRKGNVPLPDRLMLGGATVSRTELNLNYDGNKLRKDKSGAYILDVSAPNGMEMSISFHPEKPAVRHGDNGIVRGHENESEDMFYYFIPRCSVQGKFRLPRPIKQQNAALIAAQAVQPVFTIQRNGQGWYDHEFGGMAAASGQSKKDYAWNWVCIQLDDPKVEVSAATLSEPRSGEIMEIRVVVVDVDGSRRQFDGLLGEATFEPVKEVEQWTSVRSFRKYPVVFRMTVPSIGLDLKLDASAHPDQEFMTLLSKPAFWEGRMVVSGTYAHAPVTGLAFFERNGFEPDQTISTFFKNVGIAVRDSVEAMYPLVPTQEQAISLIANDNTKHYCDDVPLDILGQTLIAPVRLIADRGGKSWRSYAALACVDAVGGDSRKFVQWVAMPEFLHVGSLIVDDIQDKSETRRGGPCAHLVHGEPLAINAGTAAYFQCEQLLSVPGLTPEEQIKCYKLYFAALRGGHAGQALDIYGNDYLMDQVVETGDSSLLEKRICAIHRLKTAVPAGTLARMGCTVGGGTDAQIESVGLFMEAVGVAFQVMDDVLNLRGVYAGKADKTPGAMLKTLGEDIVDGKVTMPVCKYMALQRDGAERKRIWDLIKSKPSDPVVVQQVIDELERVGAVQACVDMATKIVEEAWEKVDREIPDSFSKLMLRSFGWYVTK